MAKKVSVTSVTPAIKVKAKSKAEQARTRKSIGVAVGGLPAMAAMALMNRKKDSKKVTPKEVAERARMVAKVKRTAELVAPFAKPKAGMTLKEFEKKIRTKPKTTKPEKYEDTRVAKAKADKAKAKIMKDFGKK